MTASFFCQGQKEELSTRQKAAAGTSFVAVGLFSGYLAYAGNRVNSWWKTMFTLFCSAPFTAVGGTLLTEAITELSDQNLINQAYEANCLAIRRYKVIMDHWNEGHSTFPDLAPLITIPIDSYLFSLKKTICLLHEQEDALKARLLNPFDNTQAEQLFKHLLFNITETHGLLSQIYAVLNENTVYFVENLGEDSILETASADVVIVVIAEEMQDDAIATEQEATIGDAGEAQQAEQQNNASEGTQEDVASNIELTLPAQEVEVIVEITIAPEENKEQNDESDTIPWSELTPAPIQDQEEIIPSEVTLVIEEQVA